MRRFLTLAAPLALLATACQTAPSTACTPITFGKLEVGQMITDKDVAGLTESCSTRTDCRYTAPGDIQYVVVDGVVREKSAPAASVKLPEAPVELDAAYAAKVSKGRCEAFALTSDDSRSYVTSSGSGKSPWIDIYRDESGKLMVAITDLPPN